MIPLVYTGIVAERIGVPNVFLIAGGALVALGLYSFADKSIQGFMKAAKNKME